jgi:hypothetical protein
MLAAVRADLPPDPDAGDTDDTDPDRPLAFAY